MMSNNSGDLGGTLPETVALALQTNSPENWLSAITDLGILSSQESCTADDPIMVAPFQPDHTVNVELTAQIFHEFPSEGQPGHAMGENAHPEGSYLNAYLDQRCLDVGIGPQTHWDHHICTTTPEPSPTPSTMSTVVFDFSPAPTTVSSLLSPAPSPASPTPSLASEYNMDLLDIKDTLKHKIQQKRRKSGLGDLKIEVKPEMTEVLTPADENRRERRRASNRRAALKCRQKKKEAFDQIMQDYEWNKKELAKLRQELEKERKEKNSLQLEFNLHLSRCKNPR